MREWCSCGAAFHTLSNRQLKDWRRTHHHEPETPHEPDPNGSNSQVETAYNVPTPGWTIGFQAH